MERVSHRRPGNALVRSAFALMFSTVGSAVLGMAFWALAAHLFKPDDVGRASAEVASVTLLAGLAQLSLIAIFTRFLPVAGRATGRMVSIGYAVALGGATALTIGFLVFGFGGNFLPHDLAGWGLFALSVIFFTAFGLQDSVLTALRRTPWVLSENLTVAAIRLALLPVLLVVSLRYGVLLSWGIPMAGAVGVLTWLVFGRLVPAAHRSAGGSGPSTTRKELISYAGAQYVGGIVGSLATMLPPVLVASRLGTQASAYFYFPWLFGTSCNALLWNVVFTLVVEAAHDAGRTRALVFRAIRLGSLVTFGGGLVLGFGAPWVLAVIGPQYADGGTTALRLIALSLPFVGVGTLYNAVALIQKRTWKVTILQAVGALLFLGLGIPAMSRFGGTGMALAFLASRVFIAAVAVPGVVRHLRALPREDATPVRTLSTQERAMAAETQVLYLPFGSGAETQVLHLPFGLAAETQVLHLPFGLTSGYGPLPDYASGGSTVYLSSTYRGGSPPGPRPSDLDAEVTGTLIDGGVG